MCGRRHVVVLMTCLGMLISIGSRAVFTIVVTHIIEKSPPSGGIIKMKCINKSKNISASDWPKADVLQFQMAYYVGTLVTQVPAGILAARFSSRRVSGVATLATSILTICISFALQYKYDWPVYMIRVIQGLIEGSIVPSFNGVLAQWVPKSEKSILVVVAYSGAYLSAFVADIVSGMLVCKISDVGSPLYVYGGVGILWSVIWLLCLYDRPAKCPGLSEKERQLFHLDEIHHDRETAIKFCDIPWRKIFTSLPLSAIFVASFNRNWIFAILLTQLPQFFQDTYHMTPANYGLWTGLPHVFMTLVLIPVGLFVNTILHKKLLSVTVARKIVETIGFGTEGICMLILGILAPKNDHIAIILLCLGVGVSGFAISGYQVNCLDLAPRYTSVLTGIIRMGTIGAVISQIIAIELTKYPGGWNKVFIIAGALHLAGVVYYLIFASGERQAWDEHQQLYVQTDQHSEISEPVAEDYDSDEKESLLSKTLRVERVTYSDELEESNWFLSTI